MKKMSVTTTQQANGGSVRCSSCGWTTWGLNECKNHIKRNHKHGLYVWYKYGPYNRVTREYEHSRVLNHGSV